MGAPGSNPVQGLLLLFSFLFHATSPGTEWSKWRIILHLRKRSCCTIKCRDQFYGIRKQQWRRTRAINTDLFFKLQLSSSFSKASFSFIISFRLRLLGKTGHFPFLWGKISKPTPNSASIFLLMCFFVDSLGFCNPLEWANNSNSLLRSDMVITFCFSITSSRMKWTIWKKAPFFISSPAFEGRLWSGEFLIGLIQRHHIVYLPVFTVTPSSKPFNK